MTGLPTDGTVLLADGVTKVYVGEILTAAQLTGLEFLAIPGVFGQSSTFTYSVTDPSGAKASGSATLAIGPDTTPPVTNAASLTVAENAAATAIGIAAPTDANYAASQLSVKVTGLPSDGTVLLADGVTVVTNGEILTVAQLTGLTFKPISGVYSQSSTFTYSVSDPSGLSATGTATLAIAGASGPQTTAASLTVAENAAATAIGIAAPTDANYAASQLSVKVSGLPSDGTVYLADGVTAVTSGEALTVAQLTGLTFKPISGLFSQSSTFSYAVTDPSGLSASGTGTLAIGPDTTAPVTTAASLTVAENAAATAIGIAAPTDANYAASQLTVKVAGLPSDGTALLADGVTVVTNGETLTVAQLTGLTFKPNSGVYSQSSQFTYSVSDPSGLSASGTATLAIAAAAGTNSGPVMTAASLTVTENAATTTIGIAAPTDPNYTASQLSVMITGVLPTDGTVYLADGVTPVTVGEPLTVAQLTGLMFAPTPGAVAFSEQFTYSVTDPAGSSTTGAATVAIAPASGSTILTVGPGKEYATIKAAVAASQNGDTIQVDAGTYTNDFATINTNITLEGVGGMVNLVSTEQIPNGKAIFITNGNDTINNFSFSGAYVARSDANGAGIRYQAGNLVLNDDYFFNNQDGMLAAANSTGTITINNSEFANNGVSDPTLTAGYGYTHNLYVNAVAQLTINNSYFHNANEGHEIKSRAFNTTIQNSRIDDGPTGTASLSIDLPNGGNALIKNNVIEQGPLSDNPGIIDFGEEGSVHSSSSLQVTGNQILNDLSKSSALAVWNDTSTSNPPSITAQITGNQFWGLTSSQIVSGAATQSSNSFLTSEPALITTHPWSL